MEALGEQLGQQLSVDDFLSPENDYEEVCCVGFVNQVNFKSFSVHVI